MADFPAMPLWTDAYLADTMHLSVSESGAYIHLLISAWRTPDCALPNDDTKLARWARCSPREWAKVRNAVLEFWDLNEESTKWTQKRQLTEREKVIVKSKKAARAAHAKHRKTNKTNHADALPEHPREQDPSRTQAPAPDLPSISISISNKKEPISLGDRQADHPTIDLLEIPEKFRKTKPDSVGEHFGLLWDRYRSEVRRVGALGSKSDAEAAFRRHVKAGVTPEDFNSALDGYVASLESEGNVGTSFVMRAEKWFRKGWMDEHGEVDDFKEWLAAQ